VSTAQKPVEHATNQQQRIRTPSSIMSMNNTNSVDTPARRVNMDDIEEFWSPADEQKGCDDGDNGKMKIRSLMAIRELSVEAIGFLPDLR
jgi:hypothetical protein